MSEPFGHAAEPRAVRTGRPRYREPEHGANLMNDRRVSRGSSYSLYRKNGSPEPPLRSTGLPAGPSRNQPHSPPAAGQSQQSGKSLTWREQSIYDYRPPPKQTEAIDFTPFLTEQKKTTPVSDVDTQTDALQPLPEPAPYVPKKTGVDASTQMTMFDQPFDFDREVAPLLEVVVGKTLEQAMVEVEQEEELEAIARELDKLQQAQLAEAERVRAIEADTVAEFERKQRRVAVERERQAREERVRHKVASVRLMKQVWPDLRDTAFEWFDERGLWTNRRTQSIRGDFLPWLFAEVDASLAADCTAVALLDGLVDSAFAKQREVEHAARKLAEAEAERRRQEEEERRRNTVIRVFVDGRSLGLDEDTQIGPIQVLPKETVGAVEAKVKDWLADAGIDVELPEDGFLHLAFSGVELGTNEALIDYDIANNARLEVLLPAGEEGDPGGEEDGGAEEEG